MVLDDMRDEIYNLKKEIKKRENALEEIKIIIEEDFNSGWQGTEDDILGIIREALKDGE